MPPDLLLGLIGDNIAASRAPLLHVLAGRQNARVVQYDRLVPAVLGLGLAEALTHARTSGYYGVNVTLPYKERAMALVHVPDPLVRAIGAVNTVIFHPDGPVGHNTDHSGFMAAYRNLRGVAPPGTVLVIGAGGVGRAVAFALVALGAAGIRLVDRDRTKAEALARDLRAVDERLALSVDPSAESAAQGATGLVNCSPLGMVGYGGTPLARSAMAGAQWAFDAVYTPTDTQFLHDAQAEGLEILPGWELFFWQGVHAWELFSKGLPLDKTALRHDLLSTREVV